METLKQGAPFEEGVNVGPLIHEAAVDKVSTSDKNMDCRIETEWEFN